MSDPPSLPPSLPHVPHLVDGGVGGDEFGARSELQRGPRLLEVPAGAGRSGEERGGARVGWGGVV